MPGPPLGGPNDMVSASILEDVICLRREGSILFWNLTYAPVILSVVHPSVILSSGTHGAGHLLILLHQLHHFLEVAAEVCEAGDRTLGHPLVGLLVQRLAHGGQQPAETLQGLLVTGLLRSSFLTHSCMILAVNMDNLYSSPMNLKEN